MLTLQDFEAPCYGLSRVGAPGSPVQVPVVVVAWEPAGKGEPALSAPMLQQLVFGPDPSIAGWFRENSQGRLALIPHSAVPVVGPVQSRFDWQFYWRVGPFDPKALAAGDPRRWVDTQGVYAKPGTVFYLDGAGFVGGHTHAYAEMVLAAAGHPAIDLSAFDTDGSGRLDPRECLFLLVKAQAKTDGFRREVFASEVPPPAVELVVDGVVVRPLAELYAAPPHGTDDLAVGAEELLHMVADLADQYPDPQPGYPQGKNRRVDDPGRPGQLSVTDAGRRPVHVDPYHKLKWGWLNAQVAQQSGRYTLHDAATSGDALILYNPHIGTDEFFILENRWRGASYDKYRDPVWGEGLAVWHCIQDPALSQDWGRRAVHLRRADPRLDAAGHVKDAAALFDGADPARGYDLHDGSFPADLRFRGGVPSRLAVRQISPAGPAMTVDVTVPPEPGAVAVASGRITRLRVHAKGSGYGPAGQRLPQDCIVTLDCEPAAAFGIALTDASHVRMFEAARAAARQGRSVRVEYRSDTSYGGEVLRIIQESP